jgi:hypothetical protein
MTYVALTLEGNHFTMGWQHGQQVRALHPLIVQAIEGRFSQIERDGPDVRFGTLLQETCGLLQETDAPLLAMIRGQAQALGLEFDVLLRYDLVTYLRDDLVIRNVASLSNRKHPDSEGCTTWAAAGLATLDGGPILVKNRDYRPGHLALQVVVYATPESGYRYFYVSSAGSPGVFSAGTNQVGLAVADTHVYSTDLGPGLPDYALMMHILEMHDSVSSAVDYLRSVPRLGRNNLILADARGHLAVFESGNQCYGLFETCDGTLVNTNHFASPEMRDCFVDVGPPDARGRSLRRYERVTSELSAAWGRIDVPFAQRLMASHNFLPGDPLGSICCHPEADTEVTTISASLFLPALRKVLFCHGLPCQGHYDDWAL